MTIDPLECIKLIDQKNKTSSDNIRKFYYKKISDLTDILNSIRSCKL